MQSSWYSNRPTPPHDRAGCACSRLQHVKVCGKNRQFKSRHSPGTLYLAQHSQATVQAAIGGVALDRARTSLVSRRLAVSASVSVHGAPYISAGECRTGVCVWGYSSYRSALFHIKGLGVMRFLLGSCTRFLPSVPTSVPLSSLPGRCLRPCLRRLCLLSYLCGPARPSIYRPWMQKHGLAFQVCALHPTSWPNGTLPGLWFRIPKFGRVFWDSEVPLRA